MFMQKKFALDVFAEIYNSTTAPILGTYSIFHPTLIVRDPHIAREILVKGFSSFSDRGNCCDDILWLIAIAFLLLISNKAHHTNNNLRNFNSDF